MKGPPRVGQGYADVLVPPAAGEWLWGRGVPNHPAMPRYDWQDRQPDEVNANVPQQPAVEVSEEQVSFYFYDISGLPLRNVGRRG